MAVVWLAVLTGAMLGLASAFHCAAMCSGVMASLSFMLPAPTLRARLQSALAANLGRSLVYVTMGTILGGVGAEAFALMPAQTHFKYLHGAGAIGLVWIGFSTMGLMPAMLAFDRALAPLAGFVQRRAAGLSNSAIGPLIAGAAWGCMPCAMVYGALMTAMLTGSAATGGAVMAGFAAATVPALVASAYGTSFLTRDTRGTLRVAMGVAVTAIGFLSLYAPIATSSLFCG